MEVQRQRWLLALCGATAILIGVALWMTLSLAGDSGANWTPSGTPFIERVAAIDPGSPAERAGERVGDTLDLRDLMPADRLRFLAVSAVAQQLTLPIVRDGVRRTITVTMRPLTQGVFWRDDGWDQVLSVIGEWWSTFFAGLIVWRRRDQPAALILSLLLLLINFGTAISSANFWITPWPGLDAALNTFGLTISGAAYALLATYAMQFARPISRLRRIVTSLAYIATVVFAAVTVTGYVGQWFGTIDTSTWFFGQPVPAITLSVLLAGLPLACAGLALRAARGVERMQLAWASGALAVIYIAQTLFGLAVTFNVLVHPATLMVDVAVFVAPLGLTYALLNRRLLDIGFVINRAAVAAILSASGIAAFVLIEWVLSTFLARLGPVGVLIVNIIAAIALGLIAPTVYHAVATVVDRLLFARTRRAREAAVRLTSGLPYLESSRAIATALTRDLCLILEISCGAVFLRATTGRFECSEFAGEWADGHIGTDEVERIVLQLTADRRALDLHQGEQNTSVPSLVLPLESRQELIGFVAYAGHAGGVHLDPDERAILADAARQASRGFDAIELASRVELAYQARMAAEAEAKETLRRTNATLERINEAQARFVPAEFLRFLRRESIADVELGDSTLQTMTVLFSDIRSFTTISEGMAPPEIFAYLNDYMRRVGPLVREHRGFIDKYIGDAVMGLFPESASDALQAAVALQQELRVFNVQLERERKPRIAAGVGIHTGRLMLGTIGERGRMEATVIADAVNSASRLESATKVFGCSILISRETYEALDDPQAFMLRRLGTTYVKGKREALEVYECFSGDTPEAIERKLRSVETFANAVAAFEAGHIALARAGFSDILAADRDDGAARAYLERCAEVPAAREA